MNAKHSIQIAAAQSGLSSHLIRIWERRYGIVQPERTSSKRRLYSDQDIARLSILRRLTQQGHAISNISGLTMDQLEALQKQDDHISTARLIEDDRTQINPEKLADLVLAIRKLDERAFDAALSHSLLEYGSQGILLKVLSPLARKIGTLWRDGKITSAHEHFATAQLHSFILQLSKGVVADANAPTLVIGVPTGQLHELGALLAKAAAANIGWNTCYVGPSLPAAEIAGAAVSFEARAVALSVVYPDDDPNLPLELRSLRKLLPANMPIVIGGDSAPSYREAITTVNAMLAPTLSDFQRILESIRKAQAL